MKLDAIDHGTFFFSSSKYRKTTNGCFTSGRYSSYVCNHLKPPVIAELTYIMHDVNWHFTLVSEQGRNFDLKSGGVQFPSPLPWLTSIMEKTQLPAISLVVLLLNEKLYLKFFWRLINSVGLSSSEIVESDVRGPSLDRSRWRFVTVFLATLNSLKKIPWWCLK